MSLNRRATFLGWLATGMSVVMYASLLDQIALNLSGQKGSLILPIAIVFNSALWLAYGWSKLRKDWPIIVSNIPGILLGAVCTLTAYQF